ncbi:MAG: GNAT family N-acetyltransferase [Actinobacteria bacterium]|nr:MAG: GNAT family N-acetyltransferase [Actinomycetota bacterium]
MFRVPWSRDEYAWLALGRPPLIYLGGITLSPRATAEHMRASPRAVYDSWNRIDLAPFGFRRARLEIWYFRPPLAMPAASDPDELTIERVDPRDLVEFETVSVRGFGGEDVTVPAGSIHPPNPDPRLTCWLGRVDGQAVCAAISYETDRAVGIFGVTTVVPARGRGYATALMRRAILVESGKPAVLNTDNDVAMRVYERLGFQRIGECPLWSPGPVTRTEPDDVLT